MVQKLNIFFKLGDIASPHYKRHPKTLFSAKMNINKLLVAVKKETERTSKEITSYTIGALARKRRLEKRLTLSEVSKNICSISYLSKIESNKIIPNKRCLELLMERIDVSKWEIYALENCDSIMKELVNVFLYGNTQKLKELFDQNKAWKYCYEQIVEESN